ncbi:Asp23/Gls24 family envelope stress response protein [Alicyclobacillus cycloheptanicus]|uniref:Alkaline shock family protein YloU n=1 Tax=Alicyclobacillus cycloheptanicus TaxID=1457 RepID=A0ABT9XKW3_9BACL|nr:Asp23/Gls24 family envelope stress response protein [Alicyclobacillus cycloheptanicus]MDQ0190847.1 putative alkaline shock family protein YloU [Alicyclobacillus cycloheptanicus]WDM01455.1 Asp23/Gls24 family envelope stress response protein [Alicyclobacillus cycloheptanicus]
MPKTMETALGTITIAEDVVATLAGLAAMDCYGLVGMASRRQVKDSLSELLGRDNPGKGVEVRIDNDFVEVDLYIIVSYGTNIYEVAQNVREKVRYVLNQSIGIQVDRVNILVQGVRVTVPDR